jgi:serine/threonine protein kinase
VNRDLDRERRALEVFESLIDLSPEESATELAAIEDPGLRDAVRSLLDEDTLGVIESGALEPELIADSLSAASEPMQIPGFRIVRPLASGGMGRVYEAEQLDPRRTVALKTVRREVDSESARGRFRDEIDLLARLKHPLIAQIHAAGIFEDRGPFGRREVPFFAMEFVEDASTVTAFARRLDRAERLQLLLQVCEAIAYGHGHGVIHRDIKPSNVLVDSSGRVRVIDFGIARVLDAEAGSARPSGMPGSGPGTSAGTPNALPPECFLGTSDGRDVRADVYALGVLAYQILVGAPPHALDGKSTGQIATHHRSQGPLDPSELDAAIPDDLAAVLLRAVASDPDDRYPTVDALAADLRRFIGHQPVEARPAGPWHRLILTSRRRRGTFLGGSLAVVALVLGGITSVVFGLSAQSSAREARAAEAEAVRSAAAARDSEQEALEQSERARAAEAEALASAAAARASEREALDQKDRADSARARLFDLSAGLVFDVGGSIANIQGSNEARLAALSLGVEHLRALEDLALSDPSSGYRLAVAWLELGDLLGNPGRPNMGDLEGAREAYAESARLAELLAERGLPEEQSDTLDALLCLRRGSLAMAAGDQEGMDREFGAYLSRARELRAADDMSLGAMKLLAYALSQYGISRGIRGDHAGALASFQEARSLRRERVAREPHSVAGRAAYAASTAQVGGATFAGGDPIGGAELYREALTAFDALLEERPDDADALNNAVETRIPASEVMAVAGAFAEAEATARRGVELARSGLEREPTSARLRRYEALASFNIGLAQRMAADSEVDPQAARALRERAVETFGESLALMEALADDGLLLERELGYPDEIRARIERLEARLGE